MNNKKNGKGKEYNGNGELKFEGIYLYNFKLRGKEYIEEKLEYERDYMYNIKWNGRGYDENGDIIYEIINENGKVKEYDYNDNLIFDGEYLNGKRSGIGREYNSKGIIYYYGEYVNGHRWNGIGKKFIYDYNDICDADVLIIIEYDYINGKNFLSKFQLY